MERREALRMLSAGTLAAGSGLWNTSVNTAASVTQAAAATKGTNAKATTKAPAPGGGHGKVWVNSETHVYHKEGSRFYGTTKQGKYMTEAEAIKEGNKAAQH